MIFFFLYPQAQTFAQVLDTDTDGSEEKAITALGILNTMETILNVMEDQKEVTYFIAKLLWVLLAQARMNDIFVASVQNARESDYSCEPLTDVSFDLSSSFMPLSSDFYDIIVLQIILQLEGIVLNVIGIILQQNIMGSYILYI